MYLVFDIGGTNMRVGVSRDGQTLDQTKIIPTPPDFEQGLQTFKQLGEQFTAGEKIDKVVVGVAGPIDQQKTMLIASPHIPSWIQKPLKNELEKIYSCPVLIEHEADLEGLAEATIGAGRGHKIVACLIFGTGVATTRIVDGKIDQNSLGFEGGHQIIVADGSPCDCGGKGHLESYVSGSGLQKIYAQKGEEIKDPKIWDQTAKYLAIGLNNVTVFWSPDIIVLGGAVMKSIDLEQVKKYLAEYLTIFPTPPELTRARLGDQAGLFGALSLLKPLL